MAFPIRLSQCRTFQNSTPQQLAVELGPHLHPHQTAKPVMVIIAVQLYTTARPPEVVTIRGPSSPVSSPVPGPGAFKVESAKIDPDRSPYAAAFYEYD